jgi:glycerol-3-phosphate acyltransferase PlsY
LKGGKGVATSCGVLIVLLPAATIIGILVFIGTVWLTKYVSLGSILLSIAVPIATAVIGREIEYIVFSVAVCILICYRHKDNIRRLLLGTENKVGTSEVSSKKS